MIRSTRLVHRATVAEQTLMVRVERPADFAFHAGQYLDLTLPDLPERDALGPVRSLSIASAPHADHLDFLLRMRESAFKRTLATLPLGSALTVEGPFDDLGYHAQPGRARVFLAGGVGVAPFLSIIREAAATGSALPATLFYSNRRPEDAAYLDELQALQERIEGFRFVPTMTQLSGSKQAWSGETERLGTDFLTRYLGALVGPSYYIAGSTLFLLSMRDALAQAGVPDGDVGLEVYTGY